MSDLQIGLISLGVILILVLVCFNWWQDRRVRQRMQEHFPEADEDPLMGGMPTGGRREPGLGPASLSEAHADESVEADPICEAVIDVVFSHPVSGAELQQAVRSIHKAGEKPVRVLVEHEGGHTLRLREGNAYLSVQLAVLLANRSGPLTDIEWSHIWTIAQDLAERFEGSVEGPDQAQVLQRAKELDELCAGLDAQVGLALRLGGARPVAEVNQAVKDAGFLAYGNQLAWMSEAGIPRFTLLFDGVAASDFDSAGVDRLDLLLDVPRSQADEQAFSRMASVGRDLASRLQATLIDDQGQPVQESADQAIDQKLYELYQALERAGFPAADERTMRLFS
ncbi:MAG TPA: cell division protein ZipA C-terminal FtsZ-binding domain-containing protein [Pusillimonas sp.]|uniref:cell division protein ZipA C-terminal FtsZ-binding domain-containing protein n=1 Tax=Pusillimonas sp. TaxID=3040095 RepID=UPI002C45FA75|nr:cell division protein ZipA C-terminal FtsZ-binding domain-containing protein [Pusillimonas sp.]HUH87653.1 cell division protein ZipA C-terminal FtsZ-binding domain-containing protein [Pusillimonas sp.]